MELHGRGNGGLSTSGRGLAYGNLGGSRSLGI